MSEVFRIGTVEDMLTMKNTDLTIGGKCSQYLPPFYLLRDARDRMGCAERRIINMWDEFYVR